MSCHMLSDMCILRPGVCETCCMIWFRSRTTLLGTSRRATLYLIWIAAFDRYTYILRIRSSWEYVIYPGPGYTSYSQTASLGSINSNSWGLNEFLIRIYFVGAGDCCGRNWRCVASPPTKCGLGFVGFLTGVPDVSF